jgi:pimeloyl-ACP methyl ester carboxylesterase
MTDLHLTDVGHGPTVLCLHGIGSSSRAFEPQQEELGGTLRLVAWDAPGYGKSPDPDEAYGLDQYADAAAEVIRGLGSEPVHVLGVSWGGVIAVRLANRHPDLVRCLILADSSRGSGQSEEQAEQMRGRAAELGAAGPDAFASQRAPRLVSDAAPRELVARVQQTMAESIRLPGYGYAAESMAETDLTGELAAVAVPTLVLCGTEDTVTGIPESQALAGGIQDAVFVTLRDAGHLANQEQPVSFNAWVEAFIHIVELLYR